VQVFQTRNAEKESTFGGLGKIQYLETNTTLSLLLKKFLEVNGRPAEKTCQPSCNELHVFIIFILILVYNPN